MVRLYICIAILTASIVSTYQPCLAGPFLAKSGCRRCHTVKIDPTHNIGCKTCHHGNPNGYTLAQAHQGLISMPSHPAHMARTCGRCHAREVAAARSSMHFTLSGEIGTVWSGFFPGKQVPTLSELPVERPIRTKEGLVSDALRRRCLRCHVYYRGDTYRGTRRGTGCAACHMDIQSRPWDHRFHRKVSDSRCLSCHYGNFVGWDYYGRFEADYPDDYRAPLIKGRHMARPYGVEWHDMTPDVHKKAGMTCTDCHRSGPCQGKRRQVECLDCHLRSKRGPAMDQRRIGHRPGDIRLVTCAACHAVWSFQDQGRSLIREDLPDYDDWAYLSVQGDSEVERSVKDSMDLPYEDWTIPRMLDKISGHYRTGMWFEGFTKRSWGVRLGEDSHGRLSVMRPILDLSLSYIDSQDVVRFDNLRPDAINDFWLSYSPHTIGPADVFRTVYVMSWLEKRNKKISSKLKAKSKTSNLK
ncbi:MAG: hypothetical protein GWP10_02030 [Nitrospiraceae bacterium]|nr:hypothetical protein [Nitrospiraceae bacterium]